MPVKSTNNYLYRYQIGSAEDLSQATWNRRLTKFIESKATGFYFDFRETKNQFENLWPLFFKNWQTFNSTQNLSYINIYPEQAGAGSLNQNMTALKWSWQIDTQSNLQHFLSLKNVLKDEAFILMSSPDLVKELKYLSWYYSEKKWDYWYFSFTPYNPDISQAVTLRDIYNCKMNFPQLPGLEIENKQIPQHYELYSLEKIAWQTRTEQQDIQISIVIPSYNNVVFLSQVLEHLEKQNLPAENFELIVVEDGGQDQTCEILKTLWMDKKINLKMIYWPKSNPTRGEQNFFRAGLARNLGVRFAVGENLIFLDSDMLVPQDFLSSALDLLKKHDLIQFQRYHIHQNLSFQRPTYESIIRKKDTYIEEHTYWNQLFQSENWMSLPQYWKYACTYGLAMKKEEFLRLGGFKKYYVSYGFEDTDLGYQFFKNQKRFYLAPICLYHLTSYDHLQYKNSQIKRMKLLRKTAALFYLQHLDPQIYECLGNFYRFEKPILRSLQDFVQI